MGQNQYYLLPFEIEGKGSLTPGIIRSGKKTAGISGDILKKRDEIFNSELEAVIQKVSSKEKNHTGFKAELKNWASENLPDSSVVAIINNVYLSSAMSAKDTTEILSSQLAKAGIDSFAVLLLDKNSGCYIPFIHQGIDRISATNLVFTFQDERLRNGNFLEFTPSLLEDPFFRKKLSNNDLEKYRGIRFIDLKTIGVNAFLLFLYEKEKEEFDIADESMLENIHLFAPAFISFSKKVETCGPECKSVILDMCKVFRKYIFNGERECWVHRVRIMNFYTLGNAVKLKKETMNTLRQVLDNTNLVMEDAYNGFSLFSRKVEKEELLMMIRNPALEFEITSLRYPDYGKNLFLYL